MRYTVGMRITLIAFAALFLIGCNRSEPTGQGEKTVEVETGKAASTISILAWNIQSGGNDPATIADQLSELQGYDVYCLNEVSARNLERYASVLPAGFVSVNSVTGSGDRLQIIFDSNRLRLLEQQELHRHGGHELNNGNHRSPLFVRLQDRTSGVEFIVMTNHLARKNADLRAQQAVGLREWARDVLLLHKPTV